MDEKELIRHYRDVYRKYSGEERRVSPHERSVADVAAARRFLAWCADRRVDPAAFVELRFSQMSIKTFSWRQPGQPFRFPRFNGLRSEALVPLAQRSEAQAALSAQVVPIEVQRVRDLSYLLDSSEMVRRRNAGQPQLCMLDPASGGFDPRSAHCPRCPLARECARRLAQREGFDVGALRGGDIHRLPAAVRKALRNWNGRV